MSDRTAKEITAEIETAFRKELEPFLHTALIPGGVLDDTNKALIKEAALRAVESVLQNRSQRKARMTLQTIKDATTKENLGDPERNWLISECERLGSTLSQLLDNELARCQELELALAPFAKMSLWGMKPSDRPTKLDRDCERAAKVLYYERNSGTNRKEDDSVEQG